jgi:hypothetical protein
MENYMKKSKCVLAILVVLSGHVSAENSVLTGFKLKAAPVAAAQPLHDPVISQSEQANVAVAEEFEPERPMVEATVNVVSDVPAAVSSKYSEVNGEARFHMNKGPLKPQVVELLMAHPSIDAPDDIQWLVNQNLVWPNEFTVVRSEYDAVLNDILKPYSLVATFQGNGAVVITNI